MGWQGLEGFGTAFAPLADAQLKSAYQDYQAQKDLNEARDRQIRTQLEEQQAAQLYGYDSPRVQRMQLDPLTAQYLMNAQGQNVMNPIAPTLDVAKRVEQGAKTAGVAPVEGQGGGRSPNGQPDNLDAELEGTIADPKISHLAPYLQQLAQANPGIIDEQGRIHPYIYKKVSDMMESQAKLEAEANAIAGKAVGNLYGIKQKHDAVIAEKKLDNEAKIAIQGMKGSTAEKIQALKNKGFADTTILKAISNEKIAGMKEEGATGRTKIKEEGSTGRAIIRSQTAKEIQGMKGDNLLSVWDKRDAIERAKLEGRFDLAQAIQDKKDITAKELEQMRQGGSTQRTQIVEKNKAQMEANALKAGKYKKYPPAARVGGVGGAAKPQGYRETSVEKSLRQSISNKEKMLDFMGRRDRAQAEQEIANMRAQLAQMSGGGAAPAAPQAQGPARGDAMYQAWLTKHGSQDTPNNWKFFNEHRGK